MYCKIGDMEGTVAERFGGNVRPEVHGRRIGKESSEKGNE